MLIGCPHEVIEQTKYALKLPPDVECVAYYRQELITAALVMTRYGWTNRYQIGNPRCEIQNEKPLDGRF